LARILVIYVCFYQISANFQILLSKKNNRKLFTIHGCSKALEAVILIVGSRVRHCITRSWAFEETISQASSLNSGFPFEIISMRSSTLSRNLNGNWLEFFYYSALKG